MFLSVKKLLIVVLSNWTSHFQSYAPQILILVAHDLWNALKYLEDLYSKDIFTRGIWVFFYELSDGSYNFKVEFDFGIYVGGTEYNLCSYLWAY